MENEQPGFDWGKTQATPLADMREVLKEMKAYAGPTAAQVEAQRHATGAMESLWARLTQEEKDAPKWAYVLGLIAIHQPVSSLLWQEVRGAEVLSRPLHEKD